MKNIRSNPFKITRIQKSPHVAFDGNRRVKHRRGWSRRNLKAPGCRHDEERIEM